MSAKTVRVSLQVPGEVSASARELARRKAHEAAVLTLWEQGEISSGRAAEELELSAHGFLDLLAARGLPVVRDFDPARVEATKGQPIVADPV